MGTLTVNATNGQTVAAGASYTVPYPAGKSAGSYLTAGAKITTSDGSIYSATVSLGASSITITNPTGRAIESGGFDYLDLQNAGVVARFNALGEGDILLGPKNTERSLAEYQTDSNGNVVGLLGPNGEEIRSFPKPKHRVVREFVTLREVTNVSGGTPAVASIDLNSPFGGPALKLAMPAGCTDHTVTISGFSLPNFTAGRGKLVALVYFSDARAIRTSWNSIGTTTGFSPTMRCTHDLATDGIHHSHGVQAMTIHSSLSTVNTLATTDTVTALKLVMLRSGAAIVNGIHNLPGNVACDAVSCDVWIKGIYLVEETKPFVVLTMDDGTSSQYDNLQPLLAARGLKATLGIISGSVGSNDSLYMNTTELQAMYDYGHDLCPHNVANTSYTIAGDAAYVSALRTCRDYLRNLGWARRLDYHPYVGGAFNPDLTVSAQSEGIKWARTVNNRNFERPLWDYGFHGQLPSRSLGNGSNLATAQGWITTAESSQQDVIIMGHEFKATAENSITWATSDMELFLDFCLAEKDAGRIAGVGSLSEYARYLGFES